MSGGIAAYKSPDLVRRLREAGADVRVVMSRGGQAFVTPLTFQAVSGNPVHHDLLDETAEAGMGHIELARWADAVLIAPASANRIAALAQGLADDLLSTLCLASAAPLFVAPAMNRIMWENAALQENIATLRRRGVTLLGPAEGEQACGEIGAGRMLEAVDLRDAVSAHLHAFGTGSLSGLHVLLTAGPTQEALDPVRYLSNRSSGKMGFALAEAARNAGAAVTLIAGPVSLVTPDRVERIDVISAQDMHTAVLQHIGGVDVFIGVAAVADYRADATCPEKIKKSRDTWSLELVRNPDILAEVAARQDRPFCVGFAAETHDVERYAVEKMRRKRLDMIAANPVGGTHSRFACDDNHLTVLTADGQRQVLTVAPKTRIARQLIELIAEHYNTAAARI